MSKDSKPTLDPHTGQTTTGHSWDGLQELNTPLPRWWLWIYYATIIWSILYWIVYPAWPLLHGATTILYEGKPVGTPDAGAFWRILAEYGAVSMFTAPTAFRAIKREDASGALMAGHDLGALGAHVDAEAVGQQEVAQLRPHRDRLPGVVFVGETAYRGGSQHRVDLHAHRGVGVRRREASADDVAPAGRLQLRQPASPQVPDLDVLRGRRAGLGGRDRPLRACAGGAGRGRRR